MLYKRRLAFCLLAFAACGDNRSASTPPDGPPPDGDGEVCSLDLSADALDGGTWDTRFTYPGFTGPDGHAPTVYNFARDIDGSILAAGEFTYVGIEHVAPLMRLKNGAWEPARSQWELPLPDSGFSAVAVAPDGKLALATYDDFGPRSTEIWLDDGTGLQKIADVSGIVRRLIWFDGNLWAAGLHIIGSGASELHYLTVWDGTTWSAPPGGLPNGPVFEVVQDGKDLLVGGYYDQIGGVAANSVAAYNGTAWRSLDFPIVGAGIYALARGVDNELYAGGTLGNVEPEAGGLMRLTGTTWELVDGGLGNRMNPGVVTDLAVHDGSMYVSGCFFTAGGAESAPAAVTTPNIARYDGAWHGVNNDQLVLGPWYEERQCGDEDPTKIFDVTAQSVFSADEKLLLAGSFPGISGVPSQGVISYDGTAWHPEGGATGLGIAGSLDRIGVSASGCDLWGTGQFTHVAGEAARSHVLHFTGNSWTIIEDTLPLDAYCNGFAVSPAGDVALSCLIFADNGDTVSRMYRVDGTQLVQVGGDFPLIQTITYDADGTLWVGGGTSTGFVGKLDGETITMVDEGFDAPVNQIDPVAANDVIVAGYFSKVGDIDASKIARWNGTTWSALGAGLPGSASALAHDGNTVYVSTYDEGSGMYMLGAWDGTSWKELATPEAGLTPNSASNFNAIKVIDGAVIAVGTAFLDDNSGKGALVYRNGKFTALGGGGVHAISLSGLAVTSDSVWVGGNIAEAGSYATATPTVGIARYITAH